MRLISALYLKFHMNTFDLSAMGQSSEANCSSLPRNALFWDVSAPTHAPFYEPISRDAIDFYRFRVRSAH